jgi:hypothetical protein
MLSNHENRERMRCKLVENLQFDSHFEASRLRDYSGYSSYFNPETTGTASTLIDSNTRESPSSAVAIALEQNQDNTTDNLTQKLQLNKQAINNQINEDFIGDDEFLTSANSIQQQANQPVCFNFSF